MCWLDEAAQHGSVVTSHQGVVILVTNMWQPTTLMMLTITALVTVPILHNDPTLPWVGRGLFSSAAATVTLYYVIKTPLISNPQRQHPFDNISRCQVFCKNLKLAALPMCWLCLLQISKIWKNTAVCGPLWSAVAAIHRWMVSTNSSALPPMTIVLDPGMAAVCFHCNLFRFGIIATDHGTKPGCFNLNIFLLLVWIFPPSQQKQWQWQ